MATTNACPQCERALPPDAPADLCPKCLMQAAVVGPVSENEPTTPHPGGFLTPTTDSLAQNFPELEFDALLGRGGMGVVYKARQRSLNRDVAVKILPPEIGADLAFAERFTREAQALAQLSHQNIVSVFDFGQREGQFYFMMEYVDGANLRQLIERGDIQPEEALLIIPQVCEALQFAHAAGIVHRDIKPENILIDKQGRVKIADFGLAKLLGKPPTEHSLTATHQVMGTPHYMAPEQMQASRGVDHRADIYSLGVVFYEMLTGELPIGRFEPPSKKAHVDVRLDDVVLRALENEPERRYQRAGEVKLDVETISNSDLPASMVGAPGVPPHQATQPAASYRDGHATAAIQSELEAPSLTMMVVGVLMIAGHIFTIIVCLQNPGDVGTAWIGLPGTVVGCMMFIGGLNLKTQRSSGWAHLGAIAAVIPASPAWVITAFVGVWVFNVLARPHIRQAFAERVRQAETSWQPRFSWKAIIGAGWAPFFFVLLVCFLTTTTPRTSPSVYENQGLSTVHHEGVNVETTGNGRHAGAASVRSWQWALILTVVPLGLTAPFATTILGLMSIQDIRRSQGRVIGLPLAVADALAYPLLLLDALLVTMAICLVLVVAYLAAEVGLGGFNVMVVTMLTTLLLALPACVIVDVVLARAAWRKATQPLK